MVPSHIKHVNIIKAGYSYLSRSISATGMGMWMPLAVSAELTNNCNLKCPECLSGSGRMERGHGFMDLELFDKLLKELGPYLYNVNLYLQGEPMMHPLFFSFLEKSRNIHSVVSTNGHFLTEDNSEQLVKSGLNKIIVSLDGIDQTTYESYRKNGNIETVKEGIRNISKARRENKSSLRIEIQTLVNRFTENQIPQIRKFAKDVKASLSLKSMQIIHEDDFKLWLPEKEKYRRYKLINGKYVSKNTLPDRCARLWFNPVVTWDGNVLPCCFDKNGEHIMGDLNQDAFKDIWDGPKYRIFRKSILSGRHMIEICRNCTSGLRGVKY